MTNKSVIETNDNLGHHHNASVERVVVGGDDDMMGQWETTPTLEDPGP
jgi:hypothetical protein